MESKYLMAIIKMPVEIFKDGKTITHEDKCVIDYEPLNELPTTVKNSAKVDFYKMFCSEDNDLKFKTIVNEDEDGGHEDEDGYSGNYISPLLENKIFVKPEELLKKKSRSKNSTFKNKKFNTKQLSRKIYPSMDYNDQVVDLVQSQEDQESQQGDD